MKLTQVQLDTVIGGMVAASGAFDPAATFVGVFTDITDNGLNTVIGDLTMPPASVAVRQAITSWGPTRSLGNDCAAVDGPAMHFAPSSSADATVVRGWYLASAISAGDLLAYGYFPAPVALPDEFSEAGILVRLTLDPSGQWDANVYWNG